MRIRIVAPVLAGVLAAGGLLGLAEAGSSGSVAMTPPAPVADARPPDPAPSRTATPRPRPSPTTPTPDSPTRAPEREPSPSPRPEPGPPSRNPELRARLDALVAATPLPPGGGLGIAVVDEQGRPVYGHRPDTPLLPASAQKLVTAAVALRLLGPDHRFETAAEISAPVEEDGSVGGDLVLVGGGDPVLVHPVFVGSVAPDRPHTSLGWVADQIVAAGIRRVEGRVLGDGSAFADDPLPQGWLPEYLERLDGARTTALTVDAGRRLVVNNGRLVGEPEPDPPNQAAAQLVALLAERGVAVGAGWSSTRTPPPPAAEVARVTSPPLTDLLAYLVQTSENQMADQIFRAAGAAAGGGTWSESAEVAEQALADLALDWSGVRLADGSGLSRENRLTAGFLAQLDQAMTAGSGDDWVRLQAVSGQSGTLRSRLRGTVAEGRVRGKTGTLRDVRALAGAVVGPDGRRYHFTVVGNGLDGPAIAAVRMLQDEVALVLAEDLYDCVRVEVPAPPPSDPGAPQAPPAIETRCAA